jgi:hypothetical protein
MKSFDTRVYSISDFLEWHKNGLLELSPDFQRRAVWSEKAKSFLIDTIIRGRPIPKILISQKLEASRGIRTVVDGQQRLRAILEFINGDFSISRAHNEKLAGKIFPSLAQSTQSEFLKYELGVDLLFDVQLEDLLDIFARINSYTVTLNKLEKINALYLGYYKQSAFRLGHKYVDYFMRGGILTKAQITRMGEAQLAGDLLMALVGGIQSNKSEEQYYKKYEDKRGPLIQCTTQFDTVMSMIGEIYPPDELSSTNWARIHLFYTLFTSIAHCQYGLKGPRSNSKINLNKKLFGKIRVCLDEISSMYDKVSDDIDNPDHPKDYKQFIMRSRRATTDTASRIERTEFVCKKIISFLK